MTSIVYPVVGGTVARITRLDSCGRPAWGDRTQAVSDGIVSVAQTANYDDGSDKTITNMGGRKCVYIPAKAELLNLSLVVSFCAMDPDFYTAFTGFPPERDQAGNTIGYRVDRGVRPIDVGVALEVWADINGGAVCDDTDTELPYGYMAWWRLSGGRLGDYTLEDAAVTFSITDIVTLDGSQWGIGPYLVLDGPAGAPAALSRPVEALEPSIVTRTHVPPPEVTPGLVPLDDPDGVDATTATAGTPGTWNGIRPFTLAELQGGGITATPATAWTTGQFVYLGDGSKAHWTATAWAAGPVS
jgi:hypothetical protein